MNEREYGPNSNKHKEEQKNLAEKKFEKVVNGAAKTKKKSEFSKLTSKIFSVEDAQDIKEYITDDVIVPGIKNLILDFIIGGATKLFGGKNRRPRSGAGSVSYTSFYNNNDSTRIVGGASSSISASRPRFDFDEIVYATRGDAEYVRTLMDEAIAKYGFVTVADMYDMSGLTQPYTSAKYGWMNIRNADIVPVRDGYVIKLPRISAID